MNNENAPPPPHAAARGVGGGAALLTSPPPPLTAAQRSRISRNFRAAKALLARNNNRLIPSPLARCTSSAPPPRRVPLADIPPNRLPADEDLDDDFFREVDAICEMSAAKKPAAGREAGATCEASTAKKLRRSTESAPPIDRGLFQVGIYNSASNGGSSTRGCVGAGILFQDAQCEMSTAKRQRQGAGNDSFQNAICTRSVGENQRPSVPALFLDAKCEMSAAKKQPSGTETQVVNSISMVYRGNSLFQGAECVMSRTTNVVMGMERKPLLYGRECSLTLQQQPSTDVFQVAQGNNNLVKDAECDRPMAKKQQPNIDMLRDSNFTADRRNSLFHNAQCEMSTANKQQRRTDGDSNSVVAGAHSLFSVGVSNSVNVRPSTESMTVVDGGSNSMGGVGAGILFQDAKCEMSTAEKQRPSTDRDCNSVVDGAQSLLHVGNSNSVSVRLTADSARVFDGDSSAIEGGGDGILFQDAGCESTPRKFKEYFEKLNEAQREAACCDIGTPLMIVAGPGSGKTSTMVGRVLKLLKEGIGPGNILAMTFTTAAASEMRDRIKAVVGKEVAKELAISTFHSFCLKLCRAHAEKLGRTSEFLIYGHGQQRRAVIEALRLLENGRKNHKTDENSNGNSAESFKEKSKKWQKFVTKAKASGKTSEEFTTRGDEIGAGVLEHYNDILKSCNALDYHDFISCSMKLLQDFPEVRNECLEMWKAVVVDEFQDTSSMQYHLLKILASHSRVTIVGDDDQSIFSFNGADVCGFDSFRRDFPTHKQIRLNKNYRSTRCIVEAATSLISNNVKRYQSKKAETDNSMGCRITLKECHNEDAQCSFVVDKILEITSDDSSSTCSFGNVAILYRRQISGKAFQMSFRDRKIPFNIHGVAFYRKKVIKAIVAILRTILPGCDDSPSRQAFKALYNGDKEEKKMVIDYIEKVSSARKCSFISAATDIFASKISGTLKRTQLTQGRKVLSTLDMLSKLVQRESSISVIISSVSNMLPQKYLLEKRAIVDAEGGKLLNEDNDIRSVLQYLLDDVSDFLSTHSTTSEVDSGETKSEDKGSVHILKAFLDYLALRETENFRSRRRENENSVTLTTIHQSKGLEWDVVFIVKVNDNEIPLLHEFNGIVNGGTTLEEERRLMYVAMTRARKKLYVLYVLMDSNWQLLQPSRFLKEIPAHLFEIQGENCEITTKDSITLSAEKKASPLITSDCKLAHEVSEKDITKDNEHSPSGSLELADICLRNNFLMRFNVEERSIVSHLFHQWAKKPAFQQPKRLLDKVSFVIDERLRNKAYKHKDVMRILKPCLTDAEAFLYAQYVLRWEQIPLDKRAHLMREKQEHFQKQRIENSMGSSEATAKQISYLQSLGCTVKPDSRLHASRLIEQYKSL